MKPDPNMTRIVDRKRYRVATATLIAHDAYWDGRNFERRGRNTYLYRAPGGHYFAARLTQWAGEADTLTPVTLADAVGLYEGALTEHEVDFETAFPDVAVIEA